MENELGFIQLNPESAEIIPVDFRGGRQYRIDIGRVCLLDAHRKLRRYSEDPEVIEKYEKSFSATKKLLDDFEFKEAQKQARERLLREIEEE